MQAHRCDKGSWQLSREQHWTGLKAVRWISRNYCGGGAPLWLRQHAEGWVLGEQAEGGKSQRAEWNSKTLAGTQHTQRFGNTGIFWGVTLHCMQASSFHDEGSDLGPLQWK